jgi:hypothetical protein
MEMTWEMFKEFLETNEETMRPEFYTFVKAGNTLGVLHPSLRQYGPIVIVKSV